MRISRGIEVSWKTIRLELASTPEYPDGSATRSYLVRLPLDESGSVDAAALIARPGQATVRRFWPCEPDRSGLVEPGPDGWVLRCNGRRNEPRISTLEARPFRLGEDLTIAEADGTRLPFRVASIGR
jgi:hypothetical protein